MAAAAAAKDTGLEIREFPGLGRCLVTTRPFSSGSSVLSETPLLQSRGGLPPLAAFAPLAGATAIRYPLCPDPASAPADPEWCDIIGGGGVSAWPQFSAFDSTHLELVLAFSTAAPEVQRRVLEQMQWVIGTPTQPPPSGANTPYPGLFVDSATASCCRAAAEVLARREGPWNVAAWELAPEVLALCPPGALLERLLLVFTVNAHAFRGGAALFDLATKLTHSCGLVDVVYSTSVDEVDGGTAAAPVGVFRATRDLPIGRLLTTS